MIDYPFLHAWDRSRYPVPYLLAHLSEAQVQAQVVQALRTLGLRAWPVDVGAKKVRGRAIWALKQAGVQGAAQALRGKHRGSGDAPSGYPDVPGMIPRGALGLGLPFAVPLYLEIKAPEWCSPSTSKFGRLVQDRAAEQPTDDQLRFLLAAHQDGAVVGVAWSVSDALGIIEKFKTAVA